MRQLFLILSCIFTFNSTFAQSLIGKILYSKENHTKKIIVEVFSGEIQNYVNLTGVSSTYEDRLLKIYKENDVNGLEVFIKVSELKKIHSELATEGGIIAGIEIATMFWFSRWAASARTQPASTNTPRRFLGITIPRPTYFRIGRFTLPTYGFNDLTSNILITLASYGFEYAVDYYGTEYVTKNIDELNFSELMENHRVDTSNTALFFIKLGEWMNPSPEVNKAAVIDNFIDDVLDPEFTENNILTKDIKVSEALQGFEILGADNDRYKLLEELFIEVEKFGYKYIKINKM